MRRILDPEGYEDPGLKSSHLSLGEMSSEWLLGAGGRWQRGHQGWHCMGTGVRGASTAGCGRAGGCGATRTPERQRRHCCMCGNGIRRVTAWQGRWHHRDAGTSWVPALQGHQHGSR